jgi:hypothetical protein
MPYVLKWRLYLKLIELDLVGSIGDVENPHLISISILMSKDQFEEKMELLKTASTERFNNLTEYLELEVETWLVSYVTKNEDTEDILHQQSIEFRDLERSLFDITVRKDITTTPMRDYIEKWLRNDLPKITKPDQEEVVTTSHKIPAKEITKGTSTSK